MKSKDSHSCRKCIFAIHNDQPVGNFDFVAEEAYQKAYLPFVTLLERHPRITFRTRSQDNPFFFNQ